MKRLTKIFLGIVLVLLSAAVILAVWQRDNLKAVYAFLIHDEQSISQQMEQQRQEQQEMLKEHYEITITAPSVQQGNDLLNGNVTPEEVKEQLGITQALEQSAEQPAELPEQQEPQQPTPSPEQPVSKPEPPVQPAPQPKPPVQNEPQPAPEPPAQSEVQPQNQPPAVSEEAQKKAEIDRLMNQMTAELYACQVDLMARLGEMKKIALQDWNSRSPEGRTKEKMAQFGFSWLEECYDLEVEIDRQVKEILNGYRGPLTALGVEEAVFDGFWSSYCQMKVNEKAYYMNKYLG